MNTRHTYAALLRGINVSGKTMVPMAELKACFEKLGFEDVVTYINSGNVIFRSTEADPRQLEDQIEKALTTTFSASINTVVRSIDEIRELLDHLPKRWLSSRPQKCNVIFLRHTVDKPSITDGLVTKKGIEELYYRPGALLWSAGTSNLGKSEMVKLSRNPIYQEMTVRILNTVRKIYAIMQTIDAS
ncbi:MAG TPA: DUF1697 domain-containing protein [Candidatus Pristimantibacillus sp.]|nr:DUF1697 domain-containing protein [Candidatus Pristimantibacillus sp.]